MGHFEVVCKTRMLKEVRTEAVVDSEDDSFFIGGLFLGTVTKSMPTVIEEPDSDTDWDVGLMVNDNPVDFKIDTVADTTVSALTFHAHRPCVGL